MLPTRLRSILYIQPMKVHPLVFAVMCSEPQVESREAG